VNAPELALDERIALPDDHDRATLIGRAWVPGPLAGPSPVLIAKGKVFDLSQVVPTCADLMNSEDPVALARNGVESGRATLLGQAGDLLANSAADRRHPDRPYFLSPVDLQAVRACGVTFIASMLERVIEEQAKGDPAGAEAIRKNLIDEIGGELRAIKPGSPWRDAGEGVAGQAQYVVAVSGGRHRPRRRSVQQGTADVSGGDRRRDRRARRLVVEQSGARSRAGGERKGQRGGRHARQRCEPARFRGAQRAAAGAVPRTTMQAARSARSSVCSTGTSRSTICGG
jgi:hypothetical protein